MPIPMTAQISANSGGLSATKDISVNGDVAPPFSPLVSAAKNGVLTVRTDNTTGSLTMDAGHGIATGNKLDLYWLDPDGVTYKSRRGMTVGTVATNVVPISVGSGDNLPLAAAAITAAVPHIENLVVTGDNVTGFFFRAAPSYRTTFCFSDASNVDLFSITLAANDSYIWTSNLGVTNPVAGAAIAHIRISHNTLSVADIAIGGQIFYT